MELPRFIALKSTINNKYLSYIPEDIQDIRGLVKFSGEEVMSPYSKFEVESGRNGSGQVHLRCCYNNKYLASLTNTGLISAAAEQPNEDPSNWSCTLFKPEAVEDGDDPLQRCTCRFWHVGREAGVSLCSSNILLPTFDESCLLVDGGRNSGCKCMVVDWETLLVLPKHVAFKGDNGSYLSARLIESHEYLEFASTDKRDSTVANEVFTTRDGQIRIRSNYFGKFWRRSPNWIWADTNDNSSNNPDTLFSVVKIDDNTIALRNLGNNNFCKSLTTEGKVNCLNAAVSNIPREARLQVEELAISRSIYNVNFRLMDARIYNQRVLIIATEVAVNKTLELNEAQISFSHTETRRGTWNSSVSLKLGVNTTITTGIPFILEGKIGINAEFGGSFQWGETKESSNKVETQYKVVVPSMSKVIVSLIATSASCDVPFSYTQRDTLNNGQHVSYNMDDGVYTGVDSFDFHCEAREEKL